MGGSDNSNISWVNRQQPVRWVYDFELAGRDQKNDLLMLTSGVFQLLLHKGSLLLTEEGIILQNKAGQPEAQITFDQMATIFMGYDELYPARLTKNFGFFWAPIRITLTNHQQIYLIIYGSMGLIIRNKWWFEKLKQLLDTAR
ncbi:hypothetical protein SAMN05192529_10280 [Arachidicoccus rhizosphaerae]|uniref:Uncharacterized protein n=1 Tax=Arachidicoccus rhizosphaerae TaxID=551991 RepID=A0A1H3W4M3_9BACT|nr:hypothetical protein [Arachidicoccus rhizosphaerae]SDZ81292.1 hypothetical protein SAMN05192529_10280 [Arachidicoccus rhizosphaerae]